MPTFLVTVLIVGGVLTGIFGIFVVIHAAMANTQEN